MQFYSDLREQHESYPKTILGLYSLPKTDLNEKNYESLYAVVAC